jgi:hypothetical protein
MATQWEQEAGMAGDTVVAEWSQEAGMAEGSASTEWNQEAGMTGGVSVDNVREFSEIAEESAAASAVSAANAEASAVASASSAESASESASQASTSAANSATSASQSATSATESANSASSANTSANNASASASQAASSATAASTSEDNAAVSAATALSHANDAALSEANAATSEANAAASEASAGADAIATAADRVQTGLDVIATAADRVQTGLDAIAADNSATAASTSETNAATSESNASTSASASAASAGESAVSASNALTSENNASNSATVASTQAGIATTKASEALSSATTASTQAGIATTKAAEASTSASNASTSELNASNSESAASTSEANAAASASTATTQAGIATTQAGVAALNATSAADSASSASTSASNAAASATSAQESLDEFQGQYHGALATAPTVGVDAGDLYFDTVLNEMRVYDGSAWKSAGSTVNGTAVRQSYTATAGQTAFTVTGGYDSGFADVYLNGVKLVNGVDVDVTSGTGFTLTTGATAGDVVDFIGYGAFVLADHYTKAEIDSTYGSEGRTQSSTDTTEGRLLKVGDFGLGRLKTKFTGTELEITDLDAATTVGFYAIDNSVNGTTPTGYDGLLKGSLIVSVEGGNGSRVNQIFMQGYTNERIWWRGQDELGNWLDWMELYHTGNILGTVSQSGGVPTGAIIESGSNANGEYVKYADGTLICVSGLYPATETLGVCPNWVYPSSFVVAPTVSGASVTRANTNGDGANAVQYGAAGVDGVGTTSTKVIHGSTAQKAFKSRNVAIGRWY